jgi:ribosomal protein S6E (S10)
MSIISIPKKLREHLGEEGSEALVRMLNEQEREVRNSVIDAAAFRFEKKLGDEISGVRVDLANTEKRFEKKLGDEISGVRIELANTEKRFEKKLGDEISGVRIELANTEKRLGEEIGKVDKRLSNEIHLLREDMVQGDESLRTEIQASKTDTIKWMFIFWIGQVGALVGILFAFFK